MGNARCVTAMCRNSGIRLTVRHPDCAQNSGRAARKNREVIWVMVSAARAANIVITQGPGGRTIVAGQTLILCLNRGSASLKYAMYRRESDRLSLLTSGALTLPEDDRNTGKPSKPVRDTVETLSKTLIEAGLDTPDFIMHRLVRGVHAHDAPVLLTSSELDNLKRIAPLAPIHLPSEIDAVEACGKAFNSVAQGACFDTAFFQTLPIIARHLPLPAGLLAGVERYGFHGMSCDYVTSLLGDTGRTVIAHLGGGASMTAVKSGHPLDTTMGFSPTGGLMMATRCGDLDPGLVMYLLRDRGISPAELERILNRQSGLLGVSGRSADMRRLLELSGTDPSARAAVELFCYMARKYLGAMIAVLGGLDTLVFTGGIGAHSAAVRAMICAGLTDIGVEIDARRNAQNEAVISPPGSRAVVNVVHTNEELMMARYALTLIAGKTGRLTGGIHE